MESFEELRDYLHDIQHRLDLLHPQLCKNKSLVARLVRWEETWEIGARYLHNEEVLHALCFLVSQVQRAQEVMPALADMVSDCDAELFLVLPRLVWLGLLSDPAQAIELIRRLLPHRFRQQVIAVTVGGQRLRRSTSMPDLAANSESSRLEKQPCLGPELQGLMNKFWRTEIKLSSAGASDGAATLDHLVRRAVEGLGRQDVDPSAPFAEAPCAEAATLATDELMHDLEGWSMELQRHSPEDWNECSNVLVQCLTYSVRHRP